MTSEPPRHYANFMTPSLAALSVTGRIRLNNEDSIGHWFPEQVEENALRGMLVVADGMGGHEAGEVASQLVVTQWIDYVSRLNAHTLTQSQIEPSLRYGVENLHRQVREHAQQTDKSGMGTTLVSALLYQSQLWIANVGDSPAYLFRNRELQVIYQTDNEVEQLVQEGILDADAIKTSPFRNRLLQAIGVDMNLDVHLQHCQVQDGDRLLLCSDGLTTHVTADEIAHVLNKLSHNQAAAEHLVQLANDRGGKDNISILLVTMQGGVVVPGPSLAAGLTRRFSLPRLGVFVIMALLIVALGALVRQYASSSPGLTKIPQDTHSQAVLASPPATFHLRYVEGRFQIETEPAALWEKGGELELGHQSYRGGWWSPPQPVPGVVEVQSFRLLRRTGFYEIEVRPPAQLFVNGQPYSDEIKSFFTVSETAVQRLGLYLDKGKRINFSIVKPDLIFQSVAF